MEYSFSVNMNSPQIALIHIFILSTFPAFSERNKVVWQILRGICYYNVVLGGCNIFKVTKLNRLENVLRF